MDYKGTKNPNSKYKWFYGTADMRHVGGGPWEYVCVLARTQITAAKVLGISHYRIINYFHVGKPRKGHSPGVEEHWPEVVERETIYMRHGVVGNGLTSDAEGPPWTWKKANLLEPENEESEQQ